MSSVRGVVDALVERNRLTTIKTTGANEFAWNIIAWACFRKLESCHILTKIDEIITDNVACVLGTTKITPESLRNRMSRAKTKISGYGMYLIIGSHSDGRWALYIGTSSQLGRRIKTHALCVRAVRTHAGSDHQYCHKILGGDGWSVICHNIMVFKKAISIIWLYTIETIFILPRSITIMQVKARATQYTTWYDSRFSLMWQWKSIH